QDPREARAGARLGRAGGVVERADELRREAGRVLREEATRVELLVATGLEPPVDLQQVPAAELDRGVPVLRPLGLPVAGFALEARLERRAHELPDGPCDMHDAEQR